MQLRSQTVGRSLSGFRAAGGIALACIGLVATSCGGVARAVPPGTVVQVSQRDFAISVSPKRVPAGQIVLRVRNHGPDRHELIVVRTGSVLTGSAPLPMRTDGMTVDEEGLQPATVGVLEPGPTGSVRELQVRLAPGRYELICNMAGHFLGGMHTVIDVH